MARKAKFSSEPATRINQWVRDALDYSGLSQAELARRLFERGAISANDRSMVNKMVNFRDVTAEEAIAIAEITNFPFNKSKTPPPIRGEREILDTLRRIEGLTEHDVQLHLELIIRDIRFNVAEREQSRSDDQPRPATPHHELKPSHTR